MITRDRVGNLTVRVISLCALLLVFDGFDIGAIGYLLPALARSWARAPSDLTPAIVLGGVGMLSGSMIAGPLGDARGRKPVIIASVAIFGVFSIASAFSVSPASLAGFRLLTGLGLAWVGLPSALALGLLAGLLAFVPLVGPIVSAIPALLLALADGAATVGWTLAVFVGVQQIEGNVVMPFVQRRMVDLPPALLLFAIVAAGTLLGPLGALLAAPLTVVVFVLVKRLYVREALDTPTPLPGEERGD